MYDFIFLDLDGTLYDIQDVLSAVYKLEVAFLGEKLHISSVQATKMLNENHIFPYMCKESRSATAYFAEIGLDTKQWKKIREASFDTTKIDKRKAACAADLEKLSQSAPLILISSNTKNNIVNTLRHIEINPSLFVSIVSSDSLHSSTPFSKKDCFCQYTGRLLSIGDRFETDIQPMLECGGDGMLVDGPAAISQIAVDLVQRRFSLSGYHFYRGIKNEHFSANK